MNAAIYPNEMPEASRERAASRGEGGLGNVDGRIPQQELHRVSDSIIDLGEYLRRRDADEKQEGASTFALWGADGERSRFALPLWRTIYLAGAERGGILWSDGGGETLNPLVVLDLARDPARVDFPLRMVDGLRSEEAPELLGGEAEPRLAIYLGERDERRWYLVVDGGERRSGPLAARDREDILFLAGECAGLLFLRDFAGDSDSAE
jgi:hypothetical protein